MRDYKKLEVWKKAHDLNMFVKKQIVPKFPKEEKYELSSQLSRAALSIPLNIVEGCGRYTDKDFAHFLDTSLGSINEVDYCSLCALELKYIGKEEFQKLDELLNELRAKLIMFIKFLRKN